MISKVKGKMEISHDLWIVELPSGFFQNNLPLADLFLSFVVVRIKSIYCDQTSICGLRSEMLYLIWHLVYRQARKVFF